jgi:uncharacterized RDD family membrane protein YckC
MSVSGSANHFAPPRAHVHDRHDHSEGDQPPLVDATRGSRLLASILDTLPFVGVGFVAGFLVAFQKARGGSLPTILLCAVLILALIGFTVYSGLLVYREGQSWGKKVAGIRVVRADGSRVTFGRFLFLRWLPLGLLGLIPFMRIGNIIGLVNALAIFRDPPRCLHDHIADTKVVTAESSPYATLDGSRGDHLRTISF